MLPPPPVDHRNVALGKKPPAPKSTDLQLLHYLTTHADHPGTFNIRQFTAAQGIMPAPDAWGMLANDTLGDCTQAARLHMHEAWAAANGRRETFTDQDAIADYEQSCGYDPSNPNTDQGGVEADVLKWWRTRAPANRRITAYAACEPGNSDHVKMSVATFGGCYIGLALPITAQNQSVWSLVRGKGADSDPGSWGGHAVNITGYGPHGFRCVTWGYEQVMTYRFFAEYCDEAWAIVADDWLQAGATPEGVDMAALMHDLQVVTS